MQVYDIVDPLSPALLDTLPTESFSGEVVLDTTRKLLYTTNRFSEQNNVTEDHLLIINIDEASANYLALESAIIGANPYGLYCCYPADRMWIANECNNSGCYNLQYMDLADRYIGNVSLITPLSNGTTMNQAETAYIAVSGNTAYLPRARGGLFVVNLDETTDASKNPVDYWIEDITYPGDVETNGTYIYVTDAEDIDGDLTYLLLVLDPTKMPPLVDNTETTVLDKEDNGILVTQVEVCNQPQRAFLTTDYAFVTCKNEDDQGLVSVVSLATNTVVATLTVGYQPFNMALYTDALGVERYLYVGNVQSNTISIIDIPTLTVVATYPSS